MAEKKSSYLESRLMKCHMTEFICQGKDRGDPASFLSLPHARTVPSPRKEPPEEARCSGGGRSLALEAKRSGIFFVEADGGARASNRPWLNMNPVTSISGSEDRDLFTSYRGLWVLCVCLAFMVGSLPGIHPRKANEQPIENKLSPVSRYVWASTWQYALSILVFFKPHQISCVFMNIQLLPNSWQFIHIQNSQLWWKKSTFFKRERNDFPNISKICPILWPHIWYQSVRQEGWRRRSGDIFFSRGGGGWPFYGELWCPLGHRKKGVMEWNAHTC